MRKINFYEYFVLLLFHVLRMVSSFILDAEEHKEVEKNLQLKEEREEMWNMDKMREYFKKIKIFEPTSISPSARRVFSAYYNRQRRACNSGNRTTVRLLESLIR